MHLSKSRGKKIALFILVILWIVVVTYAAVKTSDTNNPTVNPKQSKADIYDVIPKKTVFTIAFLFLILNGVVYFSFVKEKKENIEKENAEYLKKLIEKLSSNNETIKLAERIKSCENYIELFREADEKYYYYSIKSAKEKEAEINSKAESIAIFMKSPIGFDSGFSGWFINSYDVFEFNK